jgi:hypothetical protein
VLYAITTFDNFENLCKYWPADQTSRQDILNFRPFCWVMMGELIDAENGIRIGNLYIHTYIYIYAHTYIHTHTYIYTHIRTKRKHIMECNGQASLRQGIFRKNASCCVSKEWQ